MQDRTGKVSEFRTGDFGVEAVEGKRCFGWWRKVRCMEGGLAVVILEVISASLVSFVSGASSPPEISPKNGSR